MHMADVVKMRRLSLTAMLVVVLLSAPASQGQALGDLVDIAAPFVRTDLQVAGKQLTVGVRGFLPPGVFNGLAVEVGYSDTNLAAEIRFGDSEPWQRMHIVPSATGGTAVAGYRQDGQFESSLYEVRVMGQSGGTLTIRDVGVFNAQPESESRPLLDVEPLIGAKSGTIIPPALITRAQWSAQAFRGTPSNLARPGYEYMTWHHAAGYSAETLDEGKAQMRAMQDLHQNIRGWSDIGYQFAIDRGGRLYQGRPFMDNSTSLSQVPILAMGAHAGGANTGNVGVVIMGCYHPPEGAYCEQEITPKAFATYINLFAFLSERYGVEPERIRGHRDFGQTACPGDNNYVLIPELISRVSTVLVTGNEPLGEATISGTVDDTGVVTFSWAVNSDFGIESLQIERITADGTTVLNLDPAAISTFTDRSLAGLQSATYLLIATAADGRRQELARLEVDIENPDSFVLSSAFPNPTSDRFEVRYFLSAEGFVTLSMHDSMGREVLKHPSEFQDADEWYTQRIDVDRLAAGVYFVRLHIESFGGTSFDKTIPLVIVR